MRTARGRARRGPRSSRAADVCRPSSLPVDDAQHSQEPFEILPSRPAGGLARYGRIAKDAGQAYGRILQSGRRHCAGAGFDARSGGCRRHYPAISRLSQVAPGLFDRTGRTPLVPARPPVPDARSPRPEATFEPLARPQCHRRTAGPPRRPDSRRFIRLAGAPTAPVTERATRLTDALRMPPF